MNYNEYDGGTTNARPCYSNMNVYGSYGRVQPIIPPTPVTVQPSLFNIMRPHNMPVIRKKNIKQMYCGPYKTM